VKVRVLARCVGCKSERWIGPGEVPEGEMPICSECFMPMVAIRAEGARIDGSLLGRPSEPDAGSVDQDAGPGDRAGRHIDGSIRPESRACMEGRHDECRGVNNGGATCTCAHHDGRERRCLNRERK
jgi:hypothetical protein